MVFQHLYPTNFTTVSELLAVDTGASMPPARNYLVVGYTQPSIMRVRDLTLCVCQGFTREWWFTFAYLSPFLRFAVPYPYCTV
jgi:hypothetical protein